MFDRSVTICSVGRATRGGEGRGGEAWLAHLYFFGVSGSGISISRIAHFLGGVHLGGMLVHA